jgi:hypothetical protein
LNDPINLVDLWGLCKKNQLAPDWVQRLVPSYGNYGGPAKTDLTFTKEPVDSLDDLFMPHDINWYQGNPHLADTIILHDIGLLPLNPLSWKRKPKNVVWAFIYSTGATTYFFWFSQ